MDPFVDELITAALAEDVGAGDITTAATVSPDLRCRATLVAKGPGVVSGINLFRRVFELQDAGLEDWHGLADGARVAPGDVIASFSGRARAVLTAERTALNFAQHLSGITTVTAAFVEAVAGTDCAICDTRKTTPLLRVMEKKAVVHGGGVNHRHGLHDGILIKENHITAAGGIERAVAQARKRAHHLMRVEVEVRNLDELEQALQAKADVVLLDNMATDTMRKAVARARKHGVLTEASGNMSLDRVRAVAETGVDYISVGALTHSAPVLDMSLLIEHV